MHYTNSVSYLFSRGKNALIEVNYKENMLPESNSDVKNNFTCGITSLCPFKDVSYTNSWNFSRKKPAAILLSPKAKPLRHTSKHYYIRQNNTWSL